MMDEMAEALGLDPVQFRLMHITRPTPGDDRHPYDSFPSVEVLTEGAKAFGWEKRNATPGAAPGRFKRGVGVGMSQHHGGLMGYHEGEEAFAQLAAAQGRGRFRDGAGSRVRRLRDHEDRAARQRIECRHGAGASGRGDAGIHDPRSHSADVGRHGYRAVERRVVRRPDDHAAGRRDLQRRRQAQERSAGARLADYCTSRRRSFACATAIYFLNRAGRPPTLSAARRSRRSPRRMAVRSR